jgi:hypothetical protein
MQTGIATKIRAAALALAALGASLAVASPAHAAPGPELVQLSYDEAYDGSYPIRDLQAYAYRVDALRFTTHYDRERASAGSQYLDHVTDTNIHAHGEARHPWKLVRRDGGAAVITLIREQLSERGVAKVRVRARGDGGHLDRALVIDLSECASDPPIYPVSCEIRVR